MSLEAIPEKTKWLSCVFINLVSNEAVAIELPMKILFYDPRMEGYRPKEEYLKRLMSLVNDMADIEAELGIRTAWDREDKDDMEEVDYVVGFAD